MQSRTREKDLAQVEERKLTEDMTYSAFAMSQMWYAEPGGGLGWLASRGVARG